MNTKQRLALVVLAYLAYRFIQSRGGLDALVAGGLPALGIDLGTPAGQAFAITAQADDAALNGPPKPHLNALGLTSTVAGATASAVGAAGVAASAALAATGVAAAGALIVWGIVEKGWFRGGEEGVKVNPARDEYWAPFVAHYFPGRSIKDTMVDGFGHTVELWYAAFVRAATDAGLSGDQTNALLTEMGKADTMKEWAAAVSHVDSMFQSAAAQRLAA